MASSYFMLRILKRKRIVRSKTKVENEITQTEYKYDKLFFDTNECHKCRICLKEGNIPIYGDGTSPDISDVVHMFGDIDINVEDEYPKHLCDACHSLLQGAVLFRKSAKESDTLLRNPPEQKLEISIETDVNDNDFSDNNNINFETSDELRRTYKCKICKLKYNTFDEYIKHKNSKQHKNVRVQCPICYGLLTVQLYRKHLARHQSASHLICDVCGKLYRKDNLVRHLQLHSFDLPFQCQQCPYRGRFMESLRIHMRTHTGDKPFSCDKCQLRFLTRSNLNRHLLTHKKERPFKCIECGRGFYTKRDMDIHFKSDHAGIKDFGCKMCGSKYGTRKALMRHELRVHKRDKMAKGRMPLYLQAEYRKQNDE